ncbi:MAG: oleate hydratase [Coprococcus sp.]
MKKFCREWLYHIGVPTDQIDDWAKNRCNTTTCFMPYINRVLPAKKRKRSSACCSGRRC